MTYIRIITYQQLILYKTTHLFLSPDLKKQPNSQSIYLLILQLVHIFPVLRLSCYLLLCHQTFFPQLHVETLIFTLPPFLFRFTLVVTLVVAIFVQQSSFVTSKVV